MTTKRKWYQTVHVESGEEFGNPEFDLEYYMLEKELFLDGSNICTYGVEVDKFAKENGRALPCEYRKVYDLFCTEKDAKAVLDKLARNTVTPVCLLEVLENLIGTGDLINEETSASLH